MAKPHKKAEARRLRREKGMSVKAIAREIGVSYSSVSVWVRDIELTPEQRAELDRRHYGDQPIAAAANKEKHYQLRLHYQEEGRAKAREGDPLHLAGCMLYWGEGAKNRNTLIFSNSDTGMMQFYMRFLRKSLQVPNEKISFRIQCYLNNKITLDEIQTHWMTVLNLGLDRMTKCAVNNQPTSSQQKGRKLLYGTCHVTVSSTQLIQHIYGAIQEYSGIDNPDWVK